MPATSTRTTATFTAHAVTQMQRRGVSPGQVLAAAAHATVTRQATGRLEVRGRNGITYITDPAGDVVLTVLPHGTRPPPQPGGTPECPGIGRDAATPRRRDAATPSAGTTAATTRGASTSAADPPRREAVTQTQTSSSASR